MQVTEQERNFRSRYLYIYIIDTKKTVIIADISLIY